LVSDDRISSSEPVRNRSQGTLFSLTPAEATYLLSWLKERDAEVPELADEEGDTPVGHLTRVTFHPSYTYEDFVEGFKPQPSASGSLQLALEDGVFKRVCAAARLKPSEPFLLIIDEVNRGNIPKIFGELITLLERDKRGLTVTLPLSRERFDVPANVFLVGTMNTADRSIRLLDTALRRRFAFMELMPDVTLLEGAVVGGLDLGRFLSLLNDRIAKTEGREKQIGHSFLLDDGEPLRDSESFSARFRHEIVPLLQEYAFEDYRELESYLGRAVVDVDGQRIRASVLDDPQSLMDALTADFHQAVTTGDDSDGT
jgi:5-methylcytosine-specific restriction protein B